MTRVLHLFRCLRHRLPMQPLDQARAIADSGLQGCAHGRSGSPRQVLLMDIETLTELGLVPGAIKENITTQGLDLHSLPRGQRLRIGDAILEVTLPCEPCKLMDDIRPGLQQQLRGRRGQLCRVIQSGLIRPGDPIHLLSLEQLTA
jgi:MOSC domain-containing protein YiiM